MLIQKIKCTAYCVQGCAIKRFPEAFPKFETLEKLRFEATLHCTHYALLITLLFTLYYIPANAQTWISNNGAAISIGKGSAITLDGNLHNDSSGVIQNSGIIGHTDVIKNYGTIELSDTGSVMAVDSILELFKGRVLLNSNKLIIYSSDTGALQRTNGYLIAEDSLWGTVRWYVGEASAGTEYMTPFFTDSLENVSLKVEILEAGIGNGYIAFGTYHTSEDNEPKPVELQNYLAAAESIDSNSLKIADRYWVLKAEDFSQDPIVKLTLKYSDEEIGGSNQIPEANLEASILSYDCWAWKSLTGSVDTASNLFTIDSLNTFSVFILHDSSINLNIPQPSPIDAGNDTVILAGQSVQIGIEPISGNVYSWTPVVGLDTPDISNPVATPDTTTTYTLTITEADGCVATGTVRVITIISPCNLIDEPDTGQVQIRPSEYPLWEIGKIYLKIKDNSNIDISNYPSVPLDTNNLIVDLFAYYGVTDVEKPFVSPNTPIFDRSYKITFTDTLNVNCFIDNLQSVDFVEYAEKVPAMYLQTIPNDPLLGQQYYLDANHLNMDASSNVYQTNPGAAGNAVVAIVDDAVLTTHEDLAANMHASHRDVADLDNNPNPPFAGPTFATNTHYSHGTHVAGIAAGVTDNNTGIASIGWSNAIMGIKTRGDNNTCAECITHGFEGIRWAADNGADVINLSWGGAAFSQMQYAVLTYAQARDVVVVASAGDNSSSSSPVNYPAAYGEGTTLQPWEMFDRSLVIAVTSLDANNDMSQDWGTGGLFGLALRPNFGNWVDIAAYGSNILSSVANSFNGNPVNDEYLAFDGTSQAAPQVSGVAGLMRSYDTTASAQDVYNCLVHTANPDIYGPAHPDNTPGTLGAGRLDAQAALRCMGISCTDTVTEPLATIFPSASTLCLGDTVELSVNDGTGFQWSTGDTSQNIFINQPGTYQVIVTYNGGCMDTASISIDSTDTEAHMVIIENSGLHPNDGILCGQDFLQLYSYFGLGYRWSAFGATTPAIPGVINAGSNLPFTWDVWVEITGVGGCPGAVDTAFATIQWLELPDATITPDTVQICVGDSVTLTAGGGVSYEWSTSDTTYSIIVSPLTPTTYIVTVTDSNGCSSTAEALVEIAQGMQLSTSLTHVFCPGDSTGAIDLTVTGGVPGYTYEWSTGDTTEDISDLPAGIYTVTVTDNNNCTATVTDTIVESPELFLITSSTASTGCDGTATVDVECGTSPFSYQWDDPDGQTTDTATGLRPGTYNVTVTDDNGITAATNVTVANGMDFPNGITVSSSVTWANQNYTFGDDLVISNGVTLTLQNTTLQFARFDQNGNPVRLIIRPGAELIMNGSTLTHLVDCNEMWHGVIVQGVTTSLLGAIQLQELSGTPSSIEYAYVGIQSGPEPQPPGILTWNRGGIISAENANFINNQVAVKMNGRANNKNTFSGCRFETNDNLIEQNVAYLTLTQVDLSFSGLGGQLYNNIFVNNATVYSGIPAFNGYGIYAQNSNFTVQSNSFYNLSCGIYANAVTSSSSVKFRINYFYNNNSGMILSGVGDVVGDQNGFYVAEPYLTPAFALHVINCTNVDIRKNHIHQLTSQSWSPTYGSVLQGLWPNSSAIVFDNTFEGTDLGIQTEGVNNAYIRCNQFANDNNPHGEYAWRSLTRPTNIFGGIYDFGYLPQQGSSQCRNTNLPHRDQYAAGNKWITNTGSFTCTPSNERDVFITPPHQNPFRFFWPFEYWRHTLDINTEQTVIPECSSLWGTPYLIDCEIDELASSCQSAIRGLALPDSSTEENIDTIEARLEQNDSIINESKTIMDSLSGLMDGQGNTDSLITLIKEANDIDYLDSILNENSPLSDSVLLQVIFGPDDTVYPAQKRYDLLAANLPLHPKHWMYLNMEEYYLGYELHVNLQDKQENGPFDSIRLAYMVNDNLVRNLETERPVLEAELRKQFLLAEDSTGERQALESAKSFTGKLILTDRLFAERNFSDCQDMLDTLPDLVENEWLEQAEQYVDYMELLLDAFATDSTIEIDSLQKLQLETWADDTTSFIYSRARSLMSLVYDSLYEYHILDPEYASSKMEKILEQQPAQNEITSKSEQLQFSLYPNPNNGNMTLEYHLESGDGLFKLFDLTGRELGEVTLPQGNNKVDINITYLDSGLYLFRIGENNSNLFTGRLVIAN